MADKQLTFEENARASLMRGVEELARVVGLTLGPSGRNVLLSRTFGLPIVCSDGVTIAKEVELPEPYENMGAQLVKEAASKTNDMVGDGTTTSVVLAQAIVRGGFLNVAAGANGMAIKSGIDQAVEAVNEELKKMAIPVEDREQIARVAALSAHEEAIASLIADAMDKSAGTASLPLRSPRHWRTSWRLWRACGWTGATFHPTLSPIPSAWKWYWRTPTS